MSGLPIWVTRWWDVANDRRQRLILRKYKTKAGLTKDQEEELEMLQRVADAIISFRSPLKEANARLDKLIEQIEAGNREKK